MSDELDRRPLTVNEELVRFGIEALKAERDDLVRGIDRIQLTAVKWARAVGGDTPLALVAQQLRDLIGSRATEPSSPEGLAAIER